MSEVNLRNSVPSRQKIVQELSLERRFGLRNIFAQVTSIDASGLLSKGAISARLRLLSLAPAVGERRTEEVHLARFGGGVVKG